MTLLGPLWDKSRKYRLDSLGLGQFGSEAPVRANLIFSRLLNLKKHLAFITFVEMNFKITKIVAKKFHKILLIFSMCFPFLSMGHFSTFISSAFSSWCQLIIMFSIWLHKLYFPHFKYNVMWIGSKVTVALILIYIICLISTNEKYHSVRKICC